MRLVLRLLMLAGLVVAFGGPAYADLRVCNTTNSRVGLALGYLDGETWISEGWFTLKPQRCEIIIRGKLGARYFYIHALDYDRGGNWSGPNILCTREVEFSIRGPLDCYARGYDRAGFLEIDTTQQPDWTVELSEGGLVQSR